MKNNKSLTTTIGLFISVSLIFCFAQLFLNLDFVKAQEKQKPSSLKFEPNRPKFALLVGISKYKNSAENPPIDGCQNNVSLLAETLIKDYGFKEGDVNSDLVNGKATKDEIIKKFRSHLIENAKKANPEMKPDQGAVIVYYFCGHGSQYPDQDDDENDGLDETFVAYDSRTDGVFDILDDELDDLKAELRPFTTNTTLILESCHSGTGTRDTQYTTEETKSDNRERKPYQRKFKPTSDADALTYTEIAASLSTHPAKSEKAEFCNCEKPMSLMTKALIQGLKRASYSTTYRGLMSEVSSEVATQSQQEPQVEGNRDAILFGGAAKRAKPYIEIDKKLPKNQIIIKAGTIHGLKVGSQVSIYSSQSLTNSGKECHDNGTDCWLTNGIVTEVRNFVAVVQLPNPEEYPKVKDVKETSHVILTSPAFGGGSILFALNSSDAKMRINKEVDLQKKIEEKLEAEGLLENQIVKLIPSDKITLAEKKTAKGIIRLKKGKIGEIFQGRNKDKTPDPNFISLPSPKTSCEGNVLKTDTSESEMPNPETEVYYLDDGGEGGNPLFGKFFNPQKANVAAEIAQTIRNYAFQMNLRSLDNAASTLPSQIDVTFQTVTGELKWGCENGNKKPQWNQKGFPQELKGNKISIGTYFKLNIKNISGAVNKKIKKDEFASGEPFHITVILLKNNGDIELVYPATGAKDPVDDGKEISGLKNKLLKANLPVSNERYIVIISKKYVDFSFYQSVGTKKSPTSLLEQVLTQSGNRSKDVGTLIPDEPDQWGVKILEVNIVEDKPNTK